MQQGATRPSADIITQRLCDLYERPFGGRQRGRYRISRKLLRRLAGRERLPPHLLNQLTEELFERGFVLIDMESFFVLLEQRVFRNYRRVPEAALGEPPTQEHAA